MKGRGGDAPDEVQGDGIADHRVMGWVSDAVIPLDGFQWFM
jgi:hypothetical protein